MGLVCGCGLLLGLEHVVGEDGVEALRQVELVLLQLAQTADHQRVFEVAGDARLEQAHVVVRELGHAVFEQAPD